MTLFTPPMMTIYDKMIFALADHHNVTLFEKYTNGQLEENLIDAIEDGYLDKLENMDCEELKSLYTEVIGDWRTL